MKQRVLLVLLMFAGVAFAGLLEVKVTHPLITFQNTSASALTYTATNQLLALDALPTAMQFSAAEVPVLVTGTKTLSIRALVDNLGNLVGGVAGDDFTLSGTVTRIVGGATNTYSGVLLTGEVTGFGFLESGATDQYDFRFTPTGGALFNFFSSGDIGVQVTSGASTFTGVFSANFNGRVTGNVGLSVSVIDYFTESFDANDNDLDNQMFTFTPDSSASFYRVCHNTINALPTNPGGGTTLPLSDDSYAQVTLSGGAQVSLYGTNYSSFFVGSNGYITFGSGDSTYPESFSDHFNRPRISALFDDLYPGSNISWRQLPDRVAVTWLNIAEYGTSDQNTFQIELFFDGRIRISYLAIAATDGLAGLSRGTGLPANFVESDFSSYGSCVPATFVVTPTNAFSSTGVAGGPFTPDTRTYTLSNTNSAPLTWSVTKTAAWLDLSATNGTLAAGDSTNITVAFNAVANTLAADYYADTVLFNDSTSGAFIARAVNLGVLAPPAAPSNLTATPSADQANLYWYDNSFNEDGFEIERAPDSGGSPGTWTQIATVVSNVTYYTDTGLAANTTYWYRVRAYNVIGDSPYSNEASVTIVPPGAPTSLTATPFADQANLYWYDYYQDEDGFKIERAPDIGGSPGTWVEIATVSDPYAYYGSYTDTGLAANTTYWYRVRAYNVLGDSLYSNEASVTIVPPGAPSNLTATIVGPNQVGLSWSDNSADEAGFKIERAPDSGGSPGTWTQIATVGADMPFYGDTGVTTNTTYWYRVRAYNVLGDSPYSNEASVTIAPPTAAPTSLTATTATASQINLSWTDNSNNETSFKIERSTDGTNFTQIAQVLANTTYYRNTGLLADTIHYYRLRASNPVDDSAFSNVASAGTLAQCSASVVGWGDDGYGQATTPAGLSNVVAFAAGYYHSLALESDGTIVGWGADWSGQATPPPGLTGVVAIAGGYGQSLALKGDGTVVGWGDNGYGQATPPANLSNVVALAAGTYHSLALKSDGTVVGFGHSYYATPPAGLVGVVAIAAGGYHSLALKSDGTVVGWGDNGYGQTTAPAGLTGVAIAAGIYHSLALKSDGTVVGWGYNGYGQTTPPAGLTGVAIAAGGHHSLALSTTPTTPSGLAAVVLSVDEVGLSWNDNGSNSDGFKIERAPDDSGSPGTWTQIVAVAASTTNYTDTGLTPQATYWYRVQAFNVCTNSPYSTAISVLVREGKIVRVMQWNVERHLGQSYENFNSPAQAIARIVNYNQPDILLFNEIDTQGISAADNQAALIDWVANNVPYLSAHTFYVAVSSQTDSFIRNAAISRYPIETAGTYDDGLRGLHSFKVRLSGANALQVFHAHLKCCSDDCPRKHYEAQFDADTISAWAATNTIPYVFAGDWNDDEQRPLCSPPNTITTIREGGGLVEFRPRTLDGLFLTWSTSFASIRFDYCLAGSNRLSAVAGAFDSYVFDSNSWAENGLYTDANPQNLANDSRTASDHYCVFVNYFLLDPHFTVTLTNAFASIGIQGGPFSPSNHVCLLSNVTASSQSWVVTNAPSWLTISPTNGTLAGGATANVILSITNAAASVLAPANYAAAIHFFNPTNGGFATVDARLAVLWPPPVASFSGSPTNGTGPLAVTFTDASTGNITNRFWDFGDGGTTNILTNSVTHTYTAGTFTVRLIVSGPGGVSTNTEPNYINVLSPFQNWQVQYFGSTNNPATASSADPDGDGQNNMAEFLSGTDATNSASTFRITAIARQANTNILVTWTMGSGKTNALQATAGDGSGGFTTNGFTDIFTVTNTVGTTTNYLDVGAATNFPSLYYRVRLVP